MPKTYTHLNAHERDLLAVLNSQGYGTRFRRDRLFIERVPFVPGTVPPSRFQLNAGKASWPFRRQDVPSRSGRARDSVFTFALIVWVFRTGFQRDRLLGNMAQRPALRRRMREAGMRITLPLRQTAIGTPKRRCFSRTFSAARRIARTANVAIETVGFFALVLRICSPPVRYAGIAGFV